MKRTTLHLENDIFQRLKQEAANTGQTIKEIVNTLLRQEFLKKTIRQSKFRLKWKPYKGRLQPGVHLEDRDSLFALMDEK